MPVQRGEIYFVNLSPVTGREQAGERPVLVLSVDSINRLPLVITVVVGTKGANINRDYPTNVRVSAVESGLQMETVFLCFPTPLARQQPLRRATHRQGFGWSVGKGSPGRSPVSWTVTVPGQSNGSSKPAGNPTRAPHFLTGAAVTFTVMGSE